MICKGCYIKDVEGYCLNCRKKLFNKAKIPAVLSFDAPKAGNIPAYQEHSKRMSISGVQLKYSLRLENKELELYEKNGQYILKPIPVARHLVNLHDAPANEHLTMQIADQLFNINTAANAFIEFKDGQPAYITKRFDVKPDGTKFMQEDFAQISNRTQESHGETFKYDGSYEEIGFMIRKYVAAAMPALEQFFRLLVFNYVISNGDAHLKNFSLQRINTGEYFLTPAYDLMSTVLHTPLEPDTALDLYEGDINSTFYGTYGYYGRENFMELAKRLGIVSKRAERIIDDFLQKDFLIEEMVNLSFLSDASKAIYISNMVEKMKRLIK